MSVVMDNDTVKQKAMDGQFDELEQAGKLVKAMNWFQQKLEHAKVREAEGIAHDKPPSAFMSYLLDAGIEFEQDVILDRAKEWLAKQAPPLPPSPPIVEKDICMSDSDVEDIQMNIDADAPISSDEIAAPPVVSPAAKPSQTKKFVIPSAVPAPLPMPAPLPIAPHYDEDEQEVSASGNKVNAKQPVVNKSHRKQKVKSSSSKKIGNPAVKEKKAKAVKDPDAPKAKKSAYDYFASDKRAQLKLGDSEMKPQEVLSAIGKAWREIAEADKAPFQAKAAADAERYKTELEAYRATHPDLPSSSSKRKSASSQKKKAKKDAAPTIADEDSEDEEVDAEARYGSDTNVPPEVGTKRSARLKVIEVEAAKDATSSSGEGEDDADGDGDAAIAKPKPVSKVRKSPLTKTAVLKQHKSRVEKASKASAAIPSGIKQEDLAAEDDLLNAELVSQEKLAYPVDYIPLEGETAVLILRPYQEFLNSFTDMGNLASEKREAIEKPCAVTGSVLRGVVCRVAANEGDEDEDLLSGTSTVSIRDSTGVMHSVLFVPFSSPLLKSDEFLISAERFDKSLQQKILCVGAQVRKLFAVEDGRGSGYWEEGSVYYVSPTMRTDPYQSMRVVWLSQEKETEDWVFSYMQTDCDVSPWEIEPSVYVLEDHNVKSQTLPAVLRIGALSPGNILDYFRSLDFADIFRYKMQENLEYCDMFPSKEDQLDLHVISRWLSRGRYDGDGNSSADNLCIATLFRDLDKMIANAKRFNECNAAFLPWRQGDMAEKALGRLRAGLVAAHPELSMVLLESVEAADVGQSLQSDLAAEI